jgi:hypothetical protein
MAASKNRKVPYMENKSPNKNKYDKVRDEFVQYINDVKKDPMQIENVDSILDKIYNFSIEYKRKENSKTAKEILALLRSKKGDPANIFPEDLDAAWQDGLDEGRRLGRESLKSVTKLFDSNDCYNHYTESSHDQAYDRGVQNGLDYASDNGWKGEDDE